MDLQDASPNRRTTRRLARAKVNLALAVDGPNADAMHPICSWMARIDLADDLLVTRLEDDRLSRYAILWHDDAPVKTPIDWSITKDLAVRAHQLLEREAGRSLPVQVKLEKRVPVGGGLGGGSADAAAMLEAVDELFDLGLSTDRLRALAASLGSDVGFFLGAHNAGVVEGVGGEISTTNGHETDMVLVFPGFGCATGAVYRAFDELIADRAHEFRGSEVRAMAQEGAVASERLFNDLAPAAERVEPRLAEVGALVRRIGGGRAVHLTGSGSTLFIVCPEGRVFADDLAKDIQSALSDVNGVRAIGASIRGD